MWLVRDFKECGRGSKGILVTSTLNRPLARYWSTDSQPPSGAGSNFSCLRDFAIIIATKSVPNQPLKHTRFRRCVTSLYKFYGKRHSLFFVIWIASFFVGSSAANVHLGAICQLAKGNCKGIGNHCPWSLMSDLPRAESTDSLAKTIMHLFKDVKGLARHGSALMAVLDYIINSNTWWSIRSD